MQILHGFLWLPRNGIRLNKEMRNEMNTDFIKSALTFAIESLSLAKDEGDFAMESYHRGRVHAFAYSLLAMDIAFDEIEDYNTL